MARVNALNGLTFISTQRTLKFCVNMSVCQCPQRAYFHFYIVTEIKYDIEPEVCQCPQRAYFHFYGSLSEPLILAASESYFCK